MSVTQWVKDSLRSSKVNFEERHHPEVFTAFQVAEKEKMSPDEVAKVVAIFVNDRAVGLVLPASRKVDLSAIENIANTKQVRLATEAEMQNLFPDCDVGTIPPLNHWTGIEFWMDSAMETASGEILIQAGTHQDAVRMRYEDWFKLVRPRVEHFAIHKRTMTLGAGDIDEEEAFSKGGRWAAIH